MADASITAVSGLHAAEWAFNKAASDTLQAALPAPPDAEPLAAAPTTMTQPLDMASGIVAQMEANVSFKANLAVFRTANDLYRALLKATTSTTR